MNGSPDDDKNERESTRTWHILNTHIVLRLSAFVARQMERQINRNEAERWNKFLWFLKTAADVERTEKGHK